MMTHDRKEQFCRFAAALLAPPAGSLVDGLQRGGLLSLIGEHAGRWDGGGGLLEGFSPEAGRRKTLSVLQREYARLFGPWGEKVSLVESAYKRWTGDRECRMVFAASKGLIMGDPALHMQELYRRASLEIPREYRSMPDHLVLELEFLALLYRHAPDEAIAKFIGDHLDWIPDLGEAVGRAEPHPFYENAVALLQRFLQHETENDKVKDRGQTKIH